jgi:UMP-CMP kinase
MNLNQVCLSSLTLFFTTTEDVMLNRLMERGKTSGRSDDNVETIKKRFRKSNSPFYYLCQLLTGTYTNDTMPVIKYYEKLNKVAEVRDLSSVL